MTTPRGEVRARFCRGTARQFPRAVAAVIMPVSSCATAPPAEQHPASPLPVIQDDVNDRRGRFREIFCAVLEMTS
jgi:hypothetical protein